jgi:uncharacterized protein YoxC
MNTRSSSRNKNDSNSESSDSVLFIMVKNYFNIQFNEFKNEIKNSFDEFKTQMNNQISEIVQKLDSLTGEVTTVKADVSTLTEKVNSLERDVKETKILFVQDTFDDLQFLGKHIKSLCDHAEHVRRTSDDMDSKLADINAKYRKKCLKYMKKELDDKLSKFIVAHENFVLMLAEIDNDTIRPYINNQSDTFDPGIINYDQLSTARNLRHSCNQFASTMQAIHFAKLHDRVSFIEAKYHK